MRGPSEPQPAHVGLAVRGIVDHRQHVIKQVFDVEAETTEVAACRRGEIGAARRTGLDGYKAIVKQPSRKKVGSLVRSSGESPAFL